MPTKYAGTDEEVQALNTYIKLTRAVSAVEARIAALSRTDRLTPSQFGVLEALHHLGPLCQGELSGKLLSSTGNMTLVLDNLEKQGLVRRDRSTSDRRKVTIVLTEAGEELISRAFPVHLAAIVQEMSVLTQDEQKDLERLCRKLGLAHIKQAETQS